MRVVTGKRHLGVVPGPSDAPSTAAPNHWLEDDETVIAPMVFDDDVVSSDGSSVSGVISGVTGSRVIHTVDEVVSDNFAVGTGDRRFERAQSVPPQPPPAMTFPVMAPPGSVAGTGPFPYPVVGYGPPGAYPSQHGMQVPYGIPVVYGATGPHVRLPPRTPVLRWMFIGSALTLTAVIGIAVGKLLFSGAVASPAADEAAPASSPTSQPISAARVATPVDTPATASSPAAQAPEPTAAPVAEPAATPDSGALSAAVTSLVHPSLDVVTAPVSGEVVGTLLRTRRQVHKGEKIFEIARKLSDPRSKDAGARVAELEKLAESDPVYKPFLAKAQRQLRSLQGRKQTVPVKASTAGTMQPLAGPGDHVDANQPLASRVDDTVWVINAVVEGALPPAPSWSCVVTAADHGAEQRARCSIDRVTEGADGIQVAARIEARKANWLRAEDMELRLVLEPPPAGAH